MARRLEEATEDALLSGGRAGRRAIEDAGFSAELKEQLLSKLANAQFREDHSSTIASAGLDPNTMRAIPGAAGEGTRAIAGAQPWTGEESQSDAVLRMLNDSRKPLPPGLRGKPTIPSLAPVDMRLRRTPVYSPGHRASAARDKATAYAGLGLGQRGGKGLSKDERQALKKEFRDRFTPGARAMPNTISGLAALANERIEDAIARGQFKNIPRGKGVQRDARADNPFIDTTEYIMNNMIKKQAIVPPWIEKQQELLKAANVFRTRLRSDWTRHAARMMASRGGSLREKMERATEYARAEEVHNPRRRDVDQISVPTNSTDDPVMAKMREPGWEPEPLEATAVPTEEGRDPFVTLTRPFRDPEWEATERSYMKLAIDNLNTLARSYNLLAPNLAQKPYFSLDRELRACFADVAPLLADAIKERAARPTLPGSVSGHGRGSLLDRLDRERKSAKVYESKSPNYGLKEMWRDFWGDTRNKV